MAYHHSSPFNIFHKVLNKVMRPIILIIVGVVILLISCFKKLKRDFKSVNGFKARAKVLWSYAGIILGAAVIASSVFF